MIYGLCRSVDRSDIRSKYVILHFNEFSEWNVAILDQADAMVENGTVLKKAIKRLRDVYDILIILRVKSSM